MKKSWKRVRAEVLERDLFVCSYCLDDATEVDHIVPVSRCGPYLDQSNLTASCTYCNRSKGALTLEEWCTRDKFVLPPWFYE